MLTLPVLLQPQAGNFTGLPGFLSYYEICQNLKSNDWEEVWLDEGKVPYAYGDGDWVGYNNIDSIIYKVDMARSYGIGGLMWWSPDLDDFKVFTHPNWVRNSDSKLFGRQDQKTRMVEVSNYPSD